MPHDVFISHSRSDKLIAEAVCHRLESEGIRCWMAPRDIIPGLSWTAAIMKGIESCRIFILIFSAQADRSQHVQREVERAFDKGLVVVPFRVEDVRPTGSLEYFLGSVHWLDALTRPMENHLESLVELVKKLVPGRDTGLSAVPDEPLILSSQVENKESSKFELTRRANRPIPNRGPSPSWRWALIPAVLLLLIVAGLTIRSSWFRSGEQKIASQATLPTQPSRNPQPTVTLAIPAQPDARPDPTQSESRVDSESVPLTSLRYLSRGSFAVFGPGFSPDGHTAAAGIGKAVTMWNVETGEEVWSFQDGSDLARVYSANALAFSPDGASVLAVNDLKVAQLLDAKTGKEIFRFELSGLPADELVFVARFSPDGRSVLTASISGLIQVWDRHLGTELRHLKLPMALEPFDFSPDGHLLLQCGMAGEISLINADTGFQMRTYPFDPSENEITSPSPNLRALSACFSADGHRILVLDGNPARPDIPGFLRLIDVHTGRNFVHSACL